MVKHFASQSRLRRPRFSSGCSGQALCFAKPPTASPFFFGVQWSSTLLRKAAYGVPVSIRCALLPVTVPKAVPLADGKGTSSLTFPARRSDSGLSPAKRTAYFIFTALLIAFRRLLYPSNKAAFFCRFHSFSFSHNSFHFRYLGHSSWHFSYRSLHPLQLTSALVKVVPPYQCHEFLPAVGFLKFSLANSFQP